MAKVHIPAAMRSLCGGATEVDAVGETLEEVIAAIESAHTGMRARLVEQGRIRSGLAVFVDGVQATSSLTTRLGKNSEVYFAPAISGG